MDFFRSRGTLLIAGFLISLGCMQFFFSRRYADAAKRESTAIGTVYAMSGSKGSTYNYLFEIDSVQLQGQSASCHTPLTLQTCGVGAKVLVYYVRTPALETRLQDFGDASREVLFTCVCLNVGGLCFRRRMTACTCTCIQPKPKTGYILWGRVAPVSVIFFNQDEGGPGPSPLGTWDTTTTRGPRL